MIHFSGLVFTRVAAGGGLDQNISKALSAKTRSLDDNRAYEMLLASVACTLAAFAGDWRCADQ